MSKLIDKVTGAVFESTGKEFDEVFDQALDVERAKDKKNKEPRDRKPQISIANVQSDMNLSPIGYNRQSKRLRRPNPYVQNMEHSFAKANSETKEKKNQVLENLFGESKNDEKVEVSKQPTPMLPTSEEKVEIKSQSNYKLTEFDKALSDMSRYMQVNPYVTVVRCGRKYKSNYKSKEEYIK